MSNPAKILYRAGQRKRNMVGMVIDERAGLFGNRELKIIKRTKTAWIESDEIVEAKIEQTKSVVGPDGGRDKAANEIQSSRRKAAKESEASAPSLETPSQGIAGVCGIAPEMAPGSSLPVCGIRNGREDDLPHSGRARSDGSPSSQWASRETSERHDKMDGSLRCESQIHNGQPGIRETDFVDTTKLERDGSNTRAEVEACRKRIIRAAQQGNLRKDPANIYARALANDFKFFLRLAKAIQKRKQKKPCHKPNR